MYRLVDQAMYKNLLLPAEMSFLKNNLQILIKNIPRINCIIIDNNRLLNLSIFMYLYYFLHYLYLYSNLLSNLAEITSHSSTFLGSFKQSAPSEEHGGLQVFFTINPIVECPIQNVVF